MDSAASHSSSPRATSASTRNSSSSRSSPSPTLPTFANRSTESTGNPPRRSLQSRNVRFPTKKLSLSSLGSKFSQLIHANDESQGEGQTNTNQEDLSWREDERDGHAQKYNLVRPVGILDEISNTFQKKKLRKTGDFPIYQDTPERPLLERSPFSSPALFPDNSSQNGSPVGFDYIHDHLSGSMRLREISGNERRSSLATGAFFNGPVKGTTKRKSIPVKAGFDTQEYIEHIEKQLQEAKEEMLSPTTNKSLKDQLKVARHENGRLKQEMTDLREMFEAEVKRSIEHRVEMEVDLKRKVRDLEEELEQKASIINDLELHYEQKRLDGNAIDSLRAAIEKLEQHKISLEEENRSINKRNEVLSELLAMSPTKTQSFELRSPVREKRPGRPMSMIIPRVPLSPSSRQFSQPPSAIASPSLSTCDPFFGSSNPAKGSPQREGDQLESNNADEPLSTQTGTTDTEYNRHGIGNPVIIASRRSTLQSQDSLNDLVPFPSNTSSPADQPYQRATSKRKPRKFMSGSTQLKPLLLPTLTGDSAPLSASSVSSSPRVEAQGDLSDESLDPTICLLSQSIDPHRGASPSESCEYSGLSVSDRFDDGTPAAHHTIEDIMAEHGGLLLSNTSTQSLRSEIIDSRVPAIDGSVFDQDYDPELGIYSMDPSCSAKATPLQDPSPRDFSWSDFPPYPEPFQRDFPQAPPSPQLGGIDLNALNQLELPEPDYDIFPSSSSDVDGILLSTIPQPLFSLPVHMGQSEPRRPVTGLLDNQSGLEAARSKGRHQIDHRLSLIDLDREMSPTPKTRASWHGSMDSIETRASSPGANTGSARSGRSELPQRSTLRSREQLTAFKNPVDIIRPGSLGARPLASLTIRTIVGTISRCTGQVQNFRRDPLALARRVIANAWLSSWPRFGRLSWWVLGLFFTPRTRRPDLGPWSWSDYDGEEIAHRACQSSKASHLCSDTTDDDHCSWLAARTTESQNLSNFARDVVEPKRNPGWRRSIMLWGKFSMAIMLAVGGAVVRGPAEMLKEIDDQRVVSCDGDAHMSHAERRLERQRGQSDDECDRMHSADAHVSMLRSSIGRINHTAPTTLSRVGLLHSAPGSITALHGSGGGRRGSESLSHQPYDEETLKAVKSPPLHVASLFKQDHL